MAPTPKASCLGENIMRRDNLADLSLFKEIRGLITAARNAVVRNINSVQVLTNFEIGRRIVEQEQKGENRAEYGRTLIKKLASRLTIEFGSGFSKRNLDYMRKFYLIYSDKTRSIVQTVFAQFEKRQILSGRSQKTQMPSAQFNIRRESCFARIILSFCA